jgi:hypothetical protein
MEEERKNPAPEPLTPFESLEAKAAKRTKRVELLATILLSLAAVLSALSAYQASRWYTEMNLGLSQSAEIRAQAAVNDRISNRQMLSDMINFLEWTEFFRNNDDKMMLALKDRFSPTLQHAFDTWMSRSEKGAAGLLPKGTPLELAEYSLPLQEESKALVKSADENFNRAKEAAQVGDDFIFSLVIFSIALFFGAVCTKFETHSVQRFLWLSGSVILVAGAITIVFLPWNIGF